MNGTLVKGGGGYNSGIGGVPLPYRGGGGLKFIQLYLVIKGHDSPE